MKLKALVLMVFMLGIVDLVCAQPETLLLTGKIGGDRINMRLEKKGQMLSGNYSYDKIGKEINISGLIEENNRLTLSETLPNGAKTGLFSGVWGYSEYDDQVTLSGTWTDVKGVKSFEFYLAEQMLFFTKPVKILTKTFSEKNKPKLFEIEAEYPELVGLSATVAANFNKIAKLRVMNEVAKFRRDLLGQTADDIRNMKEIGMSNTVEISYRIVYADNEVISVWFGNTFFSGGAHPNSYSFTLNFDLKTGRELKLRNIFKPKANYLQVLSDYCVKELTKNLYDGQEDEWVMNGAGPKLENYDSWNISRKGIVVNFDAYQVASYAAGPQEVRVPYEKLTAIFGKPLTVFKKLKEEKN